MHINSLTPNFAVSAQIDISDAPVLAARGFAVIVNNRPDGETINQPSSEEIADAAAAAGMAYHHLPMTQVSGAQIAALTQVLNTAPGPILAFCKSGTRSAMLWACARAGVEGAEAVLSATETAGYDLSPMRSALEALAAQPTE